MIGILALLYVENYLKSKIILKGSMNCHTFYLHYSGTLKICLKFIFVSLIILKDYPQSLTNADILGQGNLDLVREKSGKCQGILLSIICGNPENAHEGVSNIST